MGEYLGATWTAARAAGAERADDDSTRGARRGRRCRAVPSMRHWRQAQAPAPPPAAGPKYDLLLKGGHVIDATNQVSAVRDVAIAGGRIAAVAANLEPSDALKTVDAAGPLRHAGPDRHPRPHLRRHRRAALVRGRQQRLSRRLHAAGRRHDGRRRRLRRLAQLRGFQAARHRSLEDPHPGLPQHRRQRHARRRPTSRISPTWRSSRPPTWRAAIPA